MKHKKLKLISYVIIIVTLLATLVSCSGKTKPEEKKIVKVNVNEVVRSVFYAPFYAAVNNGFFKEEGIEINLTTGQGADKTMQQVLSGSADIGFCGPEQVIYIYNQNREDFPVIFANLTQKDGSFLVGRTKDDSFKWESLKGKTIIGGRPGGVPEMALEYALKEHGLDPAKDVKLITNLAFTATSGAFKAGTGDYVALFEPTATMLEKDNSGKIVASIGESVGDMGYTAFFATKSFIQKNEALIESFTRALYKGQLWVKNNSDEKVADTIISFFPGTDKDVIISVIKNYRGINAFAEDPILKEESMNKLMDVIQSYKADLIPKRPAFTDIVNNNIGKKVITQIK